MATITKLTKFLLIVILLILLALIFVYFFVSFKWLLLDNSKPPTDKTLQTLRLKYLEQLTKFMQLIVIAFVSAIIPNLISQARDQFEQYKESRLAYSKAKTAVLYLPDRVVNVDDRKKAFLLVEETHRELHVAETFKDMIISKGYLSWFNNPELWITYNYWQIVAVAEVLRECEIDWSVPENKNKLRKTLHCTLKVVHDRFGRRGERCEGEKWEIKNSSRCFNHKSRFDGEKWEIEPFKHKSRFDEEDELERAIKSKLRNLIYKSCS
jgi:hypothetical protein